MILDDYELASEWAAKYVRNKINAFKPGPDKYFVLGLPTGELKQACCSLASDAIPYQVATFDTHLHLHLQEALHWACTET